MRLKISKFKSNIRFKIKINHIFIKNFSSNDNDGWKYDSTFSQKSKTEQLIQIKKEIIDTKTSRGSGPGGQNVNKTNNKVFLKHASGIHVSCHSTRFGSDNHKIATEILKEKLLLKYDKANSKTFKKIQKIKKKNRKKHKEQK
eukprot:TRINITY_DN9874_c0_g1_i1.p1 TRINITY_DN9874_c0_g1~~TRINITY_DN9874_c0_g1_i1.p1  ORF type:complete len:143 (-),score=28.35 TRINITY_DN9874_c0_g1_i1:83-511(-)